MLDVRHACVVVHRYAGLIMALFLIIAGVTGSIMAFEDEIDAWLNPHLHTVHSRGPALPVAELAKRIEQQEPRAQVTYIPIVLAPGKSARVSVRAIQNPATAERFKLDFNQVFVDPVTGAILGKRQSGTARFDREHFIPFVIKLHYSLFLPGSWGVWLFGAVALIWTLDCLIALYLTLPRGRPFLQKWKPAWQIKRKRFNFDLHRSSGLWTWLVLLILAVSSVSLNLSDEVFEPVVDFFSPLTPTPFETREVRASPPPPAIDYDRAVALARAAGKERGIGEPVGAIGYRPDRGFYSATFRNTDGRTDSGMRSLRVYLDDQSGAVIGERGTSRDSAGDVFAQLQYPLHSGRIAGVAGRAFICLMGIAITALSITGGVIWWRKRRSREFSDARRRSPLQSTAPICAET